jgi:hypothetical protein
MQIDHDPDEPPRDSANWVYPAASVILALGWLLTWYTAGLSWHQIGMGFGTGAIFMAWAIESTGNKVPPSWRK